jgi:DNA polymerase I-like protein with 3'-5' exonuclease and polymerase domains
MSLTWTDDKFAAFDFETSGTKPEHALQPWRTVSGDFWATSLVWVRRENGIIRDYGGLNPTVEMMREMLQWAIDNQITMVGWNTLFDVSILIAYGLEDLVVQVRWLDGMLLWRHTDIEPEYGFSKGQKRSYGLKTAVAAFLPHCAGYEQAIDFHDTSVEARAKLHHYNIRDCVFTLRIARMLYNGLSRQQLRCALLEAECLPLVAAANARGILVDTLAAHELSNRLAKVAHDLLLKLQWFGVTEEIVRSPNKMAHLLFKEWGLTPIKKNVSKLTGNVTLSTDKETLHELSFADPRAADLRKYREALNNRTKFAETLINSVEYNGDARVHPLAGVFRTYSGRLAYGSKQKATAEKTRVFKTKAPRVDTVAVELPIGFALHQMKGIKKKGDEEFRATCVAPPGYDLLEFDAAGQEFRWMAIACGDHVMLQLCVPGEDAHSYMGSRIAKIDYRQLITDVKAEDKRAKDIRKGGKVANLSLQYRTSAPKLMSVARVDYDIPMTLTEAVLIHRVYKETYPGVPAYWGGQIKATRASGFVETLAGRRVKVVGDWSGSRGWEMGSTAINYRIQGTGADQKYLALAVLKPYLVSIGARFAWDLHDGIYIYVIHDRVEEAAPKIKFLLDTLPYKRAWGFTPPIPLPWDCKRGTSWGNLKEYDCAA